MRKIVTLLLFVLVCALFVVVSGCTAAQNQDVITRLNNDRKVINATRQTVTLSLANVQAKLQALPPDDPLRTQYVKNIADLQAQLQRIDLYFQLVDAVAQSAVDISQASTTQPGGSP